MVYQFVSSKTVIKRESGESPEQSRCCKLYNEFEQTLFATYGNLRISILKLNGEGGSKTEQVRRPTLQK